MAYTRAQDLGVGKLKELIRKHGSLASVVPSKKRQKKADRARGEERGAEAEVGDRAMETKMLLVDSLAQLILQASQNDYRDVARVIEKEAKAADKSGLGFGA